MLEYLHMYKLFSPKDYTFLGLIFGIPTAFYASIRNGLALKGTHPEVLRQTMPFVWTFVTLFLALMIADAWSVHSVVSRFREMMMADPSGGFNAYGSLQTSLNSLLISTRNTFSAVNWVFIIAQVILLIVFTRKAKHVELPVYESLKQSQQVTPRSNVELVAVGIGVWIVFWLYGQLVAKVMVELIQRA